MTDEIEYIDLYKFLCFAGFSYDLSRYAKDEMIFLEPQLRDLGYSDFVWGHGDYDSFGPLTRIVSMNDKDGKRVYGIYG